MRRRRVAADRRAWGRPLGRRRAPPSLPTLSDSPPRGAHAVSPVGHPAASRHTPQPARQPPTRASVSSGVGGEAAKKKTPRDPLVFFDVARDAMAKPYPFKYTKSS